MAIDVPLVLIVRVLRAEQRRTSRTCEMVHVEFLIASSDVAASESRITLRTYEVQSTEVVSFAKGVLLAFTTFDREKLLCYNLITVHAFEAVQMENSA